MAEVAEVKAWLQTLPAETLEANPFKRLQAAVTALSAQASRARQHSIKHVCRHWGVERYAGKKERPLSALCDDLQTRVLEKSRVVKDAAEGRNILCEVNTMVLSYIRGLDPAHCTEQEVQHHYLECEQENVETEEDMEHMVNVVTTCVEELIKSGELVVVTESPHSDEPELRILAHRAAAARGWGAFTCPESLLAPAAARRSAAAPSSVGQPAESALPVPSDAVFTTFDTLESVKNG